MSIEIAKKHAGNAPTVTLTDFERLPYTAVLVGSTYINGQGKDTDVLVIGLTREQVLGAGYEPDGEDGYDASGTFQSYRKGDVNLILSEDHDDFCRFIQAAELCRVITRITGHKINKDLRVAVHTFIRDDESVDNSVRDGFDFGGLA